jgi:CheY-like chemotaxis protein
MLGDSEFGLMMPNLDGCALLPAVRTGDALKDTPVVLVTARAGEETTAREAAPAPGQQ